MNTELLKAYLEDMYEVITAFNGQQALESVVTNKPDIILLDVMMPDMNGYQVCEKLKLDPSTQFIPVIMVTALSGRNDWISGIEAGADEFLTKPVNKLELLTRINSLLRIKNLHEDLLAEKNKLDLQNRIRSVLTQIIPTLLRTLPPEQKGIVIHQMIDMVVNAILENTSPENNLAGYETVGELCCQIINQLGSNFEVDASGDTKNCTIKGNCCPWGKEEARSNPILCTISRGIFSRVANMEGDDVEVDVLETMGNGDDCCLFEINRLD
ncbi:MAG: two-component system, cell cycle response regulator [Methanolobus sp.]|jgi:response regulator RpfG family c-di-GMP phosphodiesterase|nr:two-component system, cell cycle response regulator [Methanolobus sp.]MDK2834961.1 two-component system, cell cycle response regulator [Methanolobus sp.]MDK2911378.1 two-component system, cell cycle response regulator [Methanolobus sp.]MDN5310001.1 two-component system, cell cycle response regulator [Methanolobus sp.]